MDEFRVFATTELPDRSKAWVVVAVRADSPRNFVREVHVAFGSRLGGIVVSTDYSGIGGADPQAAQREFEEAERWAYNHIANHWLKNEDFSPRDFRLLAVNPEDVLRIKYEGGLPEAFSQIADATDPASFTQLVSQTSVNRPKRRRLLPIAAIRTYAPQYVNPDLFFVQKPLVVN